MARTFLTPIDLTGLELLNARIQNLASAPGTATEGRIYYDTTAKKIRYYNGTEWMDLNAGGQILDTEAVQDIVGAMVDGNTETSVAVTYDDTNGKLNFVVSHPTASTTVAGISRLATTTETTTGTSSTIAVTPAGVKAVADTKAAATHTHDDRYYTETEVNTALAGKADSTHSHASGDITDFDTAVDARLGLVVDGAPSALDTLNELAAALGDDPNFATTITNALATKATKYAETLATSATTYTITHNLNTYDVNVQVYANGGVRDTVEVDVERPTLNTITLRFAVAPAINAYRVVVHG